MTMVRRWGSALSEYAVDKKSGYEAAQEEAEQNVVEEPTDDDENK